MDSSARTIAKTLLYRGIITVLLAAITLYYTGSLGEATGITLVFAALGTLVYYVHERLWDSIKWGRVDEDSKQLPNQTSPTTD
jgi:uncharacterized membrane protein